MRDGSNLEYTVNSDKINGELLLNGERLQDLKKGVLTIVDVAKGKGMLKKDFDLRVICRKI